MLAWKKIREEVVKDVGWRKLVNRVYLKNNQEINLYVDIPRDFNSAMVLAQREDGKVIVAKQFRPGPEKVLYEIPGGAVDPGEDIEVAARRELREETGYATDEPLIPLGVTLRHAYCDHETHYFYAKKCYKVGELDLDEYEEVELDFVDFEQLIEFAKTAQMSDPAAVFMAKDYITKEIST